MKVARGDGWSMYDDLPKTNGVTVFVKKIGDHQMKFGYLRPDGTMNHAHRFVFPSAEEAKDAIARWVLLS